MSLSMKVPVATMACRLQGCETEHWVCRERRKHPSKEENAFFLPNQWALLELVVAIPSPGIFSLKELNLKLKPGWSEKAASNTLSLGIPQGFVSHLLNKQCQLNSTALPLRPAFILFTLLLQIYETVLPIKHCIFCDISQPRNLF